MAHYLRDERITNVTINADSLKQISEVFIERETSLNINNIDNSNNKKAFISWIIRFDNKGYRVFDLNDLLRYFNTSKDIERVIITIETTESLSSGRQIGTYSELRLDRNDQNSCLLTVSSDDKDWVDATFSAVNDVVTKSKNKNGWARSAWTQFGVQIIGVTFGFIISLWAASIIAPRLSIENPYVISFFFILLIFSNTWTYLNKRILWILDHTFPNLKFHRKDKERLQWLLQAIVGGIVVAIVIFALSKVITFLVNILSGIVR